MKFLLGRLGGRERAMLKHLERRGVQSRDQLLDHFVFEGGHSWLPEDFDRALSTLVDSGTVAEVEGGGYGVLVRPPL